MSTSIIQPDSALCQLKRAEDMLEAMRRHCKVTDSPLIPVASEGYLARIGELRPDIND
jgi:hypothetical protein